jgi:transcriptional regulator with XRE-family HTH domain
MTGFPDRLRSVIKRTGSTQAEFAKLAGTTQGWISDLLAGAEPSVPTLIALAKAGGVSLQWLAIGKPVPVTSLGGGIDYGDAGLAPVSEAASGFGEAEAERYLLEPQRHDVDRAIAAFQDGRDIDTWRLRTNALDLSGYLPGDIVVVERKREAGPGDVVVAQTKAKRPADVRTIWRIYAPPVLMPASSDRSLLPTPLAEAIPIGVVTGLFRGPRRT